MVKPTAPVTKRQRLLAAAASAALATAPMTMQFEGFRPLPYRDLGGKWTVCDGETNVAMHRYTKQQCETFLMHDLTFVYAPPILACAPELAMEPFALEASLDAAYNAGAGAFCRSPMAVNFRWTKWAQGCKAFIGWRATVHGVPVRGLERRRRAESALCQRGV